MKIPLEEIKNYSEITLIAGNYEFTGKVLILSGECSYDIRAANGGYLLNKDYYPLWEKIIGKKKVENSEKSSISISKPSTPQYMGFANHNDTEIKGFFGKFKFLSNFEASPIVYRGMIFCSVENAYQAAKLGDSIPSELHHFLEEFQFCTPAAAQKLGQKIPCVKDWNDIKYNVMHELVLKKFKVHKDLKNKLLLTQDKYLEETNNWGDVYWGVCNGVGKNNLGKILMEVRSALRNEPTNQYELF
jgi:ribA/ribD-fused uncharacterized protein